MIPRPVSSAFGGSGFVLDAGTTLDVGPGLADIAAWLRAAVGPATGITLPAGGGGITLRIDPGLRPQGYALRVTPSGVDLAGGDEAGVFYGAQTLRQLLPAATLRRAAVADGPWWLPEATIADAPRFGWRGVLLDVARHFMPVADVLRFVDLIAFHKLNVLHLHLTDDQGWRLDVPGWPRLAEVGAWRSESMLGSSQHGRYDHRPHGGCYSADDLREIVTYAAARHVTVVPEIDLPGHMQAAIAAYPELGNGAAPAAVRSAWGISAQVLNVSDAALDFCRAVLDETCALFPSRLIGIGGDECPKDEWKASPAAQDRMRAEGLADEHELQAWFIARMADHLATHGRRVYGWDEILEGGGVAKDAVIASWRGMGPAVLAARAGHDVVACPDMSVYLDYRQSEHPDEPTPVGTVLTLADVYAFEPVPAGLTGPDAEKIIGAQANVWTEHMESARRVDYMAFPRLCAFAETVWSSAERDFAEFSTRLGPHLTRLDALGVGYRPLTGPRPWHARPDAPGRPRQAADRIAELARLTADLAAARLEFVRLTAVPAADIIALLSHPDVRRHMPLARGEVGPAECAGFVAAKEAVWNEHGFGPWAFLIDGAFAGWGGLQPEGDDIDLALVLHPAYWGHGRAIYERLIDQAFGDLGFASVTILLPPSRGGAHAIRRLGFVPDGETEHDGERFLRYRLTDDPGRRAAVR
jgi:hexosaminidase